MDKKKHFYRMGNHSGGWDDLPVDSDELDALINSARKHIEPWLSAVFQAEHLNLLLGSGFTTAVGYIAGVPSTGMAKVTFGTTYDAAIDTHAQAGATAMKRGVANIEDQFRSALALLDGLGVIDKGGEEDPQGRHRHTDVQLSDVTIDDGKRDCRWQGPGFEGSSSRNSSIIPTEFREPRRVSRTLARLHDKLRPPDRAWQRFCGSSDHRQICWRPESSLSRITRGSRHSLQSTGHSRRASISWRV